MNGEREQPVINHGAPVFDAQTTEFKDLLSGFVKKGRVATWKEYREHSIDFKTGRMTGVPIVGPMYRGIPGMSSLCEGLLEEARTSSAGLEFHTQQLIQGMERDANGDWHLQSRDGSRWGPFEWLVVTSAGTAHERWMKLFGGPPPLRAAIEGLKEEFPEVNNTLKLIIDTESLPVVVGMAALNPNCERVASFVEAFPCDILRVDDNNVVSKVVVSRPLPGSSGYPSIVVHSTHDYARAVSNVHGRGGTAEALGARGASDGEGRVLGDLLQNCAAVCAQLGVDPLPVENAAGSNSFVYGPVIHRWGSAFPAVSAAWGDHADHAVVHSKARLAVVGDFLGEPGGRVEQAFCSGNAAGAAIARTYA